MNSSCPRSVCSLLLPALFLCSLLARAQEPALVWGRVLDSGGRALPNGKVLISLKDTGQFIRTTTDSRGFFRLVGLPFGEFIIRLEHPGFHPYEETGLFAEPSSRLYLRIVLSPSQSDPSSFAVLRPERHDAHRTVLDAAAIRNYPSGNNLWNLVENQDLSATTNRIDVGGLYLGHAALFSGRGSVSWTQTTYGLNGMDVTDPYNTGRPLLYPDLFTLRFTELDNARFPVRSFHPGASFELTTKEAGDRLRAGITVFYSDRNFTASNVTPALEQEGITESHTWNRLSDIHFELSTPLVRDRLSLYLSLTSQYLSRDIADYQPEDLSSVLAGLLSLDYRLSKGKIKFLWTGQAVHHPSDGAGREVPLEVTLDTLQKFSVFQLKWDTRPGDGHVLCAGLGYAGGVIRSDFQENADGPCRVNILPDRPAGAAPFAGQDERHVLEAFLDGRLLGTNILGGGHWLEYGLKLRLARSSSVVNVLDNVHWRLFEGRPLEVVRFNTPTEHEEASFEGRLYVQETIILVPHLSLTAGLNLGFSRGWAVDPDPVSSSSGPPVGGSITWLNLSPRLGISLPLSRRRDTSFSLSASRTYFTLPLNYLLYGHSHAPGGLVYSWTDTNHNLRFDEGEAGDLIRREGPAYAAIDPDIKRPYTDELAAILKFDLGGGWRLALSGFLRETRNLVETLNTGVPFSAYTPVPFQEAGDDLIPGSHDDLDFILYNQDPSTLGQDFYLLTNPDSDKRVSRYRGLDLTLVRRHNRTLTFFLSFQSIEAIGSASPGNTERENDDGVIGSLYDNPNTLINAKGRLRFDRGYTARLGISWLLPAGFRLASVVKYYDGQPFSRQIIISEFNQGPFSIMAHTRGVARYEYNLTVDVRLEKLFMLGGAMLRLFADGFNVLNSHQAVSENEWTGPSWPSRYATEIQSPRVIRFGAAFEF